MLKFYDPCKYNDFFRILFKVTINVKVPTGLKSVTPLPPKIICSIEIL